MVELAAACIIFFSALIVLRWAWRGFWMLLDRIVEVRARSRVKKSRTPTKGAL